MLHDYIQAVAHSVARQDGLALKGLLTINPPGEGPARAAYARPSDIDLYTVPDKFQAVVAAYLQAMRLIYVDSDMDLLFANLNEVVVLLSRAAETQSNWVCPALINCSDELLSLWLVRQKQAKGAGGAGHADLELVASTINKLFKVCLTDKSLDAATSKKASIHFFLAALIKIYFRLDKLELARSMEKALMGTGLAVPTIVNSPVAYRKHIVTYLYYSALLSLDDADWPFAETKLLTAMQFLLCYRDPARVAAHAEKILFLLLPLKMLLARATVPLLVWAQFPSLALVYRDGLFLAVKQGNLRIFDERLAQFQRLLLQRHVYLVALQLRSLCLLRLVQRTVLLLTALPRPHIVPFSAFQLAHEFLLKNLGPVGAVQVPPLVSAQEYLVSADEVECLLANFIARRWVKGYLSHGNKCVVLSKSDPFPKHSAV